MRHCEDAGVKEELRTLVLGEERRISLGWVTASQGSRTPPPCAADLTERQRTKRGRGGRDRARLGGEGFGAAREGERCVGAVT